MDLWGNASGKGTKLRVDTQASADLVALITCSVTDFAPIASPADLAKVLAWQARYARVALPDDLKPIAPLLDDYRHALDSHSTSMMRRATDFSAPVSYKRHSTACLPLG